MRAPSRRKAEKLHSWRMSLLRHRAEYLGNVQVPDQIAAKAAVAA
jgi:hypothetical protein